MSVLTDLRNRGVRDVFFIVCDGLKGLPDSVNAVFPMAIVQACVIHLIRATLRYASRKYWDQLTRDLKPIYTAPTQEAAWTAFEELEEKWGKPYPAIPKLWRAAWEEFTPFLAYGGCREMTGGTALFGGAAVSSCYGPESFAAAARLDAVSPPAGRGGSCGD
jgi:putative transposase